MKIIGVRHRLHRSITSSSRERLQMLYWLKQDAIATRKELAQKLGTDESTRKTCSIYRWVKKYSQGGISKFTKAKLKIPRPHSSKAQPQVPYRAFVGIHQEQISWGILR